MHLDNFCQYSHQERAKIVRSQGTFLATSIEEGYFTHLYYLGDFFAEIWINEATTAREFVIPLRTALLLDRYLEMVDLSEITL